MIIVSHRGNVNGPGTVENHPEGIIETSQSFLTEVDIWKINDLFFLGHDEPVHQVSFDFLQNQNLLFHAKNFEAVEFLSKTNFHWFWHQNDSFTMTNKGILWCFPGNFIESGIVVDFSFPRKIPLIKGICTDSVADWKTFLSKKIDY